MKSALIAILLLTDNSLIARPDNGLVDTPKLTQPTVSTYAAAHAQALRENKPLIVWVGGNFCARCVNDSKNEFAHAFVADGWCDLRGPATVIYVPLEGNLWRAGTVTRWTVGSSDWGHVPSARRIFAEWRDQARSGTFSPLRLLNFGDGNWGMSHDTFWRNYRGSPYPRSSMRILRSSSGGLPSAGASC